MATNLPSSLTKGSPKRPPSATAPASEEAKSPSFGSNLISKERRRSVDRAQFALPTNAIARCAQFETTSGEREELLTLASSARSRILVRGPTTSSNLSWHDRQERSMPRRGSLIYLAKKVAILESRSGVWPTLWSKVGLGHSARKQALASFSRGFRSRPATNRATLSPGIQAADRG